MSPVTTPDSQNTVTSVKHSQKPAHRRQGSLPQRHSPPLLRMGEKDGDDAPFPLTDTDKWVLSQTDQEFKYHNWDELRNILGEYLLYFMPPNLLLGPLTVSIRRERPRGSEAKAIGPTQVHSLDCKDEGPIWFHDTVPPAKSTAQSLGRAPLHASLPHSIC